MTAQPGTEEYAANLALGHALQPEIATMADTTTRARKVRQHFAAVRDALLREKDFNFSTTRWSPAADAIAATGCFTIRYPLPAECLKVRSVFGLEKDEWAVEAAVANVAGAPVETIMLVTNASAPLVEGSRKVETVRLWDALFIDVFALRLGAILARELGKSATRESELNARADARLAVAASVDSRETARRKDRPLTRMELARRGRGTNPGKLSGSY